MFLRPPHSIHCSSNIGKMIVPRGISDISCQEPRLSFPSAPEFLNFSTVDIWGHIILCYRSCSVHCRMLSSISGLYLLNTSRTPPNPTWNNQRCLQTLPKVPGRTKFPPSSDNKIMFPDITKCLGVGVGCKITFMEKHSSARTFIFHANGQKLVVFRANITSIVERMP